MTKRVRTLTINDLETPTRRLKLAARVKPYWYRIAPKIGLGYRAGPGSWNVRIANGHGGNYVRILGYADDREPANGDTVLTYTQAIDKARTMARGGADPHSGRRIVTVAEAISDYKADLIARRQNPANATQARHHLSPGMLAKPVTMLTARELKAWRNDMLARGDKAASINRRCKVLKAALNLAAREDNRIENLTAWRFGLASLPEGDGDELGDDNILDDQQRAAVIREAYAVSQDFGVYIELHAATGMRSSQIRLIKVRDIKLGLDPVLEVPSSLKGKNRTTRTMIRFPISADLAARLKAYAAGRKQTDPLTRHPTGRAWTKYDMERDAARNMFAAAGIDRTSTLYCLRHTAITRALLRNLPIRLVAASFDTSVAMIEKTYSRFIVHKGNDQLRAALVGEAAGGNVISLRG